MFFSYPSFSFLLLIIACKYFVFIFITYYCKQFYTNMSIAYLFNKLIMQRVIQSISLNISCIFIAAIDIIIKTFLNTYINKCIYITYIHIYMHMYYFCLTNTISQGNAFLKKMPHKHKHIYIYYIIIVLIFLSIYNSLS